MKLSTLAFAVAAMPVALLAVMLTHGLGPSFAPTLLQREEDVYAGRATKEEFNELTGELMERFREVAAEPEPEPEVEVVEATPLEAWLAARPSSPLALLPAEEAAKYLPTRENLVTWIESVDELGAVDVEAIEWSDDLAYLWGVCQEERALYAFAIGHSDRELARWNNREQSLGLEAELAPCRPFMDRHVGNDSEIWSLVSDYSDEVANKIRGEGASADKSDDEPSRWALFLALRQAGAPSFEAAVELLPIRK